MFDYFESTNFQNIQICMYVIVFINRPQKSKIKDIFIEGVHLTLNHSITLK